MPRSVTPPAGPELDLKTVAATLGESGVDLADDASLARCVQLLAALARNRSFLADRVIAELKASYADQLAANRYSAQVFLLHRSRRGRSEEHTSELQSLMRISYAVFCLKKKTRHTT